MCVDPAWPRFYGQHAGGGVKGGGGREKGETGRVKASARY